MESIDKIVFLDRDGVINHDPGDYTFEIEQFDLLPDVLEFSKLAKQKGFEIVVVTNQGGIAKGLYTLQHVSELHEYMDRLFAQNGTPILDIFVSTDHDKICNSISRKPSPLMVQRALHRYKPNPDLCFMVGDKESDVECARNAGIAGHQIERNSSLMQLAHLLD